MAGTKQMTQAALLAARQRSYCTLFEVSYRTQTYYGQ